MRTITIGVDLGKQVFSVCSVDAAVRVQDWREVRREAFRQGLPSVPAGTIVAMEACSGIQDLERRLPFGKVLVAIANKHARQLWAMLARGEQYDAEAWLKHPIVQRPAKKSAAE